MNLNLTEEQQLLRDSAARLFRTESTSERIRAAEDASGFDPALWAQFVAMGLHLMRIPEAAGGLGLGLFEAALVAEEAGRCLASIPLAEALVANRLLAALSGKPTESWRGKALNGSLLTLMPVPLCAGTKHVLPAVGAAGVIALEDSKVLVLTGLGAQRCENLAGAPYIQAIVTGPGAIGSREVLADGPEARAAFLAAIEEWKLLQIAVLVGAAHQALKIAAEYSCVRQQFGRKIGSFQGIAHPLADSLTDLDGAKLMVWRAIWAISKERPDAGATVSMAFWFATQAGTRAVTRAVHTHGGYGVSLEYDVQLYYRRVKAWPLLAGNPNRELFQAADRLWQGVQAPLPDAGKLDMEFGVGARAEEFRQQVRQFFVENLTPEILAKRHHSVAGYSPQFDAKLAAAGLLFAHWPHEYGGLGRDAFDQAALGEVYEEFGMQRITGPVTNQVAQIVMRLASPECKAEVMPRFARGEALACLGFSEPASGSDVFAAQTRAERQGDDWVINGQKIFTTAGNLAHYCFLLTRTNPDVAKHRGLTVFLVPMNSPGIQVQAVHTIMDERTNITYFSDVRVPDRYRIGDVDGGLAVMAATLELEHSGGDQYRVSYANMYSHAVAYAKRTGLIERPEVKCVLAKIATHTTIAQMLCYRGIWAVYNQIPERASFGPMSKLFSTEMYQKDACDLVDLFAPESLLHNDPDLREVELGYRQSIGMTIYGGTSEVHRSLIAEQGLGMPRSRS
jgi:alkylation response protein AidB-like acyl-CoA dehydrogenase